MNRDAPVVIFIAFCSLLATTIAFYPSVLSDTGNLFLRDFMDNDILSVLGFITAVGNASTLSIFLHLNHLEDCSAAKFIRTRKSLKKSAVSLVALFALVFSSLIIKPLLPEGERYSATTNSIGVLCIFFALSVLRDITITVFRIPTVKRIAEIEKENREKDARSARS